MPRWRARLPVLLLLGSYLAVAAIAFDANIAAEFKRSIDLGGLDNNIDDDTTLLLQQQRQQQNRHHPHLVLGKPSKLDLDVGSYTETDDKSLFERERLGIQEGVSTSTTAYVNDDETEVTTVGTSAEDEIRTKHNIKTLKCDDSKIISVQCIEKKIEHFLSTVSTLDKLNVSDSVQIVKRARSRELKVDNVTTNNNNNSSSLVDEISRFARDHVVEIKLSKDMFLPREARTFFGAELQGKNTFLTGFGLGFLAFGLKKLLLPLFIGVQIIKSILIALFLPSIIGSIGKIVGKAGVTSFAQSSQNPAQQMEENYEFKDNQELYGDDYMQRQPLGTLPASAMYDESMLQPQQSQSQQSAATIMNTAGGTAGGTGGGGSNKSPEIASRFAFVDPRLTPMSGLSDRYYTRHVVNPQAKRQDFKVFHEIPTSSLLLTNYDPFYSPLLSRLDAVFSRLGHNSEGCREYAVCAMYRSPARYAPYSNLVSAQLSRELNELRKPSSDNPDVLRFFRYMKAAKDGQDGLRCEDAYADCDSARDDQTIRQNQAMLATYQDIDKLVHARKL